MLATVLLIALAGLLLGLVWARTPPRTPQKPLPQARKTPAHPWASTIPGDFDDFSGPQNLYGPGTLSHTDPQEDET